MDVGFGARITIWRPYSPLKSIALHKHEVETPTVMLFGPDDTFQQEAFVWHTREDIWAGLVNEEARHRLIGRLMSDFQPSLAPKDRDLAKFRGLLHEMHTALGDAEWSDSSQQAEPDGMTAFRLNPLLAFYLQLEWICDVFADLPGASVSVQ